jgi:hypothetical protein
VEKDNCNHGSEDSKNCTDPFNISESLCMNVSRNSSVGIAMGYGPDVRSSTPGRGKRFVSTAQISDRL